MKIEELAIEGLWLITSPVHQDNRGFFREWFKSSEIESKIGRKFDVQQANISSSSIDVIRGIHYSLGENGQGKLVTCVSGSIWDVVVDLRSESPTFKQWVGVALDSKNGQALLVSEGLGHGFVSLEDNSLVAYLVTSPYSPSEEHGVNPLDPDLSISWPTENPKISIKDKNAQSLSTLEKAGLLP